MYSNTPVPSSNILTFRPVWISAGITFLSESVVSLMFVILHEVLYLDLAIIWMYV